MTKPNKIYLVSCVAKKLKNPALAAELYTSTWFIKVRALVQATEEPWFILSAKYGLVAPSALIEPYDQTLNTMRISERRDWAERVCRQMEAELPDADEIVVLAGARYREFLIDWLRKKFRKASVPMNGQTIGHQLSWLKHAKL